MNMANSGKFLKYPRIGTSDATHRMSMSSQNNAVRLVSTRAETGFVGVGGSDGAGAGTGPRGAARTFMSQVL
jgi:hypothetical protein